MVLFESKTIREIKFVLVTLKNIKKTGKEGDLQRATSLSRRLLFKFSERFEPRSHFILKQVEYDRPGERSAE